MRSGKREPKCNNKLIEPFTLEAQLKSFALRYDTEDFPGRQIHFIYPNLKVTYLFIM